jgi:dynein heavy chain
MVMEAVMILLGEKTDWNTVRSVIGDVNGFLEKLKKYDVSKTPEKLLEKVRNNYIAKKEFDSEDVGKKSVAAKSMCIWVRALDKYQKVLKKVGPLK